MLLFAVALTLGRPRLGRVERKSALQLPGWSRWICALWGVVFDKAGNLYGATQDGGSSSATGRGVRHGVPAYAAYEEGRCVDGDGDVRIQRPRIRRRRYPGGWPVIDAAGNLYGVTALWRHGICSLLGSNAGCGTVYELSPPQQQGDAWTETILYSFATAKEGYLAIGDLVFDGAATCTARRVWRGKGTLRLPYGGQCGTVFELSPPKTKGGAWTEKVLHSFAGGTDGANPNGGLVLDRKGAVYGTAPIGGNQLCNFGNGNVGCGIVFRLLAPATNGTRWTEQMVHRFADKDGAGPNGGLIFDAKGRLYGTTGGGGGGTNQGVVFRFVPARTGRSWVEDLLHVFSGEGNAPCCPSAGLALDPSGGFYGVSLGGQYFRGTTFLMKQPTTPSGAIRN